MRKKRILFTFPLVLLFLFISTFTAYAEGSGNVDGGGGSINHGTQTNNWPGSSYQGVRVTVVDAQSGAVIGNPVDFSNKNMSALSGQIYHFGAVSKIQYRNGAALTLHVSEYVCYNPINTMPLVISSNSSKASIAAIKRYFCSEGAAAMVAGIIGIDTAELTDGSCKLLIEPVIYLKYNNLYFAMTTTEAGLYNRMVGGDLGAHFPSVVMKNLALALFLEKADMGFMAWDGSKTTARTTEEMISILGIGIISYKGAPSADVAYDETYRTDTDVITAVTLSTANEINSGGSATVTFSIGGRDYRVTGIVIPKNGSQLVWVKWHTPAQPQEVTIRISTDRGNLSNTEIRANVADLSENPPPDPQADDRYDGFQIPSVPQGQNVTSRTWGVWSCRWHANWVWKPKWEWEDHWEWERNLQFVETGHEAGCPADCVENHGYWQDKGKWVNHGRWVDHGEYEDQGWYDYTWTSYSASLTAFMQIKPDDRNPTASVGSMKSGYGINMTASVRISSNAPSSHITEAQTCIAYFPEFYYTEYWRLLERMESGYSSTFTFRVNEYSTYGGRTHFTPVWFPDGSYTVYGEVIDAWTPAGMMRVCVSDTLAIRDNLFSDWHIRPVN